MKDMPLAHSKPKPAMIMTSNRVDMAHVRRRKAMRGWALGISLVKSDNGVKTKTAVK
ncbi:MAG: hypothetical protein KDE56_01750 [Anaerolineales bacterium]|nr:hypothetical protein [Anaerolineales bacterium]